VQRLLPVASDRFIGITTSSINPLGFAPLLDAVTQILAANASNRGVVVYQLCTILSQKEGDANYGSVAAAFNRKIAANYAYSWEHPFAVTVADGLGATASFNTPVGLAVDPTGNVFVADALEQLVRKVTPAGFVAAFAGTDNWSGERDGVGSSLNQSGAWFWTPEGIATDAAGNIYVADSDGQTIRKITPAGAVTTIAGVAGVKGSTDGRALSATFNSPFALAVDAAGNVFVSDRGNNVIRKISAGGIVTTVAGTAGLMGSSDGIGQDVRFHSPAGIAVDAMGNLYVVDSPNNTIRKMTPTGVVSTIAGTANNTGSDDGYGASVSFNSPAGIAIDSVGNLFVADCGNSTIRKIVQNGNVTAAVNVPQPSIFPETGVVTTIAGMPTQFGAVDGAGSAARFGHKLSIAIDAADNIYVGDSANLTLRKVSATGVVSTFAGKTGVSGQRDDTGSLATFTGISGLTVDSAGNVYVSSNTLVQNRL
jgi:hypothetical protein